MFTGIVEGACPIVAISDPPSGRRLTVDLAAGPLGSAGGPSAAVVSARRDAGGTADPITPGESLALDGVCLTVVSAEGPGRSRVSFDVIPETLGLTTLGQRRTGDRVNVERALRAGDRLGGHFVQGHVDGTAILDRRDESPRAAVIRFRAALSLLDGMIPKGSVAVDGVSLTLVEVDRSAARFSVALIPTTLERTTLGFRRPGDAVNIETDLLGKWIRRYLSQMLGEQGDPASGLTLEKLRTAGFA